jgi:predicted Zn-dependent peptidase
MELDSMGCKYNAYTSKDFTGYHIKLPNKHVRECLDILSDMLMNTNFNAPDFHSEFKKEKRIVLEELLAIQDRKSELTISYMEQQMFPKDESLSNNHFDDIRDLPKHKLNKVVDVWKTYYNAQNTFISIYGNVSDCNNIEDMLEHTFGSMSKGKANTHIFKLPAKFKTRDSTVDKIIQLKDSKSTEKSHLNISYLYPNLITKAQIYSFQIMQLVLANLISGRLFQNIREKEGLVYSIKSLDNIYDYAGFFSIYTNTKPENLNVVTKKVEAEVEHMIQHGITKKEYEVARNHLLGSISIDSENSMNVAQYNAYELFYSLVKKKPFIPYTDMIRVIQSLSRDEINKTIKTVDVSKRKSCVIKVV